MPARTFRVVGDVWYGMGAASGQTSRWWLAVLLASSDG